MVKRAFNIICFTMLVCGWATTKSSGGFSFETSLEPRYVQGAEGSVDISIQLVDESAAFKEAVLFLNVVEVDEAGRFPQAAHLIFVRASEEPSIFRKVYSREDLLSGVDTSLRFKLRERAKPATYALVLQAFEGSETSPNRVTVENRIAMQPSEFVILPPE